MKSEKEGVKLDKQLHLLPENVVFCKNCTTSNQRPRLEILPSGICTACQFQIEKDEEIDWTDREQKLLKLLDKHRKSNGDYDVIVPGSGGKDSAMVAHQLKYKYGMNPLTITWAPFEYTEIGWKNFKACIDEGGFDNILVHPNGKIHRKMSQAAFKKLGDPWQPFAYGQMSLAYHMAIKFDVPLIFFGENGEAEYGGSTKNNYVSGMPVADWAELYFKGINAHDLGLTDIEKKDLKWYNVPDINLIKERNLEFHWFSYYHKWHTQENYYYAAENTGFEANPDGRSEGTFGKYASLDDKFDGFHWFLGYIKFGLGRATRESSNEIRLGLMSREEGVALVKKYDGEFPEKYYQEFLEYVGMTDGEFWDTVDSFRTENVWGKENGVWKLKRTVWGGGLED